MPAWQTGFKVVKGNQKPTTGTNDNHHVIPPDHQLIRSHECFHCHKCGHYARNCRTRCRADYNHPGTATKVTSAQGTAPVIGSTNKFSALEEEILNDPTPAPHLAPKLLDNQRIKDLIADNLWALNTDERIKLAGEARRILKVPPGARPTRRLPKRAQTTIRTTTMGQASDAATKIDASSIVTTLKDETVDEEIRIAILERVMPTSFTDGATLATILKILKLKSVYFSMKNYVRVKFPLMHYRGQAEEEALLDSGATENFIDHSTVKRLKLGTKALNFQRPVYNVDGTPNKHGTITHACDLMIKQGHKAIRQRFYVSNLGKDRFILGYPWFSVKAPRTFDGATCTKVNWGRVSMKESSNKIELD